MVREETYFPREEGMNLSCQLVDITNRDGCSWKPAFYFKYRANSIVHLDDSEP
jgi:hypothetical protein